MQNLSKVAALVGMLLPGSLLAQTIEGFVVNEDGKAITGAKVEIEGAGLQTTGSDGRFIFENLTGDKSEIHILASGFSHLIEHVILANSDGAPLTLTLSRSPIEVIDVVATPLHMSTMESASPVSVLAGDTLRRQQAATLGDSLEKVAGVHTNFHANVASTPIIRGLSGPRVLIAQNGLDVSDVSRVGPDHSVASEASTAQQIEVLRGPATLFYGSGAIGGVVNVVDKRVPTDSNTRGEWLLETGSVNNQKLASFNATSGTENLAFYVGGYWRESDDYEVPVAPEKDGHEEVHKGVVENSAEESNGFTLGTSYLFDNGYFGIAVEQFNREYGIPGHTHGSEEDESDHSHDEENVFADLEQTRVQLLGEFNIDGDWLNKIHFRGGFTDYEHAEIEHGVTGTIFKNDTQELKVDVLHNAFVDWSGGISFHFKQSEVAAQGEEAFTPPSESQTIALAIMEEKHIGNVLVQLGARIERVTIDAENVLLPTLEVHQHEDDEHDHEHGHEDDHGHEEATELTRVFSVEHDFTPVSLSAGLVWDFTPGYNLGLSVSHSERAPSASELLSFGPHIGTRSYEIGALFAIHEDEARIGLSEKTIDLETAQNIDLTLRKTQGDIGFVFNAFYNLVDNYYYQTATGLFAEDGHDHEHGHEHGHDHEVEPSGDEHDEHSGELPVYIFQNDDVVLHGFEAQLAWQVTNEFKATIFSDYVRARLQDGGNLPRTPPLRFGTQFAYENEQLSAHLDITRYREQDKITSTETTTDGYTLVDASLSYNLSVFNQDIAVYLKGSNLTDTEARVHSSFLKSIAPRPGRNIALGVKGYF